MDREASFLRCSKLSCYSEFNKMVQVIARVGSAGAGLRELIGNGGTGTSVEYQFYYTLTAMLREIVSNNDPVTQKKDLQRVYSWYSLNKPIIKSKTRQGQTKPVLSLNTPVPHARRHYAELSRPQTAPASLCQESKPQASFTSSYITRSLLNETIQPGEPFDQLQIQPHKLRRPKSSETITGRIPVLKSAEKKALSVVDFKEVFSAPEPPTRPATVPVISCQELFNMSSGVAANMLLDKEVRAVQQNFRRRKVLSRPAIRSSSPRLLVTSPVDRADDHKQPDRGIASKLNRPASRGIGSPVSPTLSPDQLGDADSLMLKGSSLKSTTKNAMEVIQEEQLSITQSVQSVDNDRRDDAKIESTSLLKSDDKDDKECVDPIIVKEEIVGRNAEVEETSTKMTAKVTIKGQSTVNEQQTTPKRLRADVKVTTLAFITEEQIIPGAQGKKPHGHLHRHRSSRPNTVHSFRTNFTNFTTVAK